MTNHWVDLKNSDVVMIMGSNAAENHPISFKWIMKAKEDRGAKLISVDPRITKTTSLSDLYAPIRPGSDLAFMGGMINYALQKDRINREYVVEYTNAAFLINPKYGFNNGLFTGYNSGTRKYDTATWAYQLDEKGIPKRDKTLKDPNCVYQLMKKHYARYTPEIVEKVTGCPKESFIKVADLFTSTYKADRVATIMYAMGTTQHTVGTQNVRAFAIIQLLMGNIGMAGGGINALRGESNVQGSTDYALLWHILPGYLPAPTKDKHPTFDAYVKATTPKSNDPMSINWWSNRSKYLVSMLKAWYGDAATKENNYCYDWLPKAHKPTPYIIVFEDMYAGQLKGLFNMGTNPVVGGPNANHSAKAMERLDWMVCIDLWETDTSIFWKRPGVNSANIKTEVFLLPAVSSVEKEGSVSNSGRWAQWRYKAVEGPGESKSDLWFVDKLFRELQRLYKADKNAKFPDPIVKANWNYTHAGEDEPDPHAIAREINGYDWKSKKLLKNFTVLKNDGSTACGNWIYGGSYTEEGNMMARRCAKDASNKLGMYPEWAWSWPVNRRIIYNRASVNRKGEPWDPKRPVVKWTGSAWKGDIIDGGPTAGPDKKNPFIMNAEGVGKLFAGTGLVDGPLTEHYEPMESPVVNLLNSQKVNPASVILKTEGNQFGSSGAFPYVATSYRVVEHWQAGAMTRNLPWLTELVPDMFCEISPTLAKEKGIKNGDKVKIISARGDIEAYALVTNRVQPFNINGKKVEMVGMVWHFGFGCAAHGDSCNQLTPNIGDANTMIPEFKAFLVNIKKA